MNKKDSKTPATDKKPATTTNPTKPDPTKKVP
jgi:hypothetical protein